MNGEPVSISIVGSVAEVIAEMNRAQAKHGDHYMGVMTDHTNDTEFLLVVIEAGADARSICDSDYPSRLSVLVEEVGELAQDILAGNDIKAELTQVAAMALAWLEAIS